MDVQKLTAGLNDKQREAVTAPLGHSLVLAGAGSGKTRVLVHRMAWLMMAEHCSPHSLLAVTFTNKAAREMRERMESLVAPLTPPSSIGTFHSIAHRLLRQHWQTADLPQHFQILDSDDQQRTLKRVIRELNLDDEQWPAKKAQHFINKQKDEGKRPENINTRGDYYMQTMQTIYTHYEEACTRMGVIDFAELLLRCFDLLNNNADLLAHYQRRWQHILVDEFQDTNSIQYAWLHLLVGEHNTIMAVGDDDQSIYGWRGAKVGNLKRFQQDFPSATLICLEQNYRSTAKILTAANAVITHNESRLGKQLWTEGEEGEPIALYTAFNEIDEARYIVGQICRHVDEGGRADEVAVLYRSNAQSRVIEEALIQADIPYRVYGGLRFFDRAEIKDALAYLRLVANRNDDAAFERVINTPTRGIGAKTVDTIRRHAAETGLSLWQSANQLIATHDTFTARAANCVKAFLELIETLATTTKDQALDIQMTDVIHGSGLWDHYKSDRSEKSQARLENLEELISAAKTYPLDSDDDMSVLDAFLSHAALEAGDTQADDERASVQLMTLHSAKGLEFSFVFIAGLEEGLFPHMRSVENPSGLEEERRLFYVGMTRAMQRLVLTSAEIRRYQGRQCYQRPSRFLQELPLGCIKEVRATSTPFKTQVRQTSVTMPNEKQQLNIGELVKHSRFGEGIVLSIDGSGSHAQVQVQFTDVGVKRLLLAHAPLEKV